MGTCFPTFNLIGIKVWFFQSSKKWEK